jgi:hypothetical protein
MSRDEAIEKAVKECINRNVLREFLEERAREVTGMIFGEWDWDVAKEVWQEEVREEGREEVFSLLEQGFSLQEAKKRLLTHRV